MSQPVNKTMIGIFVVIAIGLVVTAIVILGSGKFLKEKPKFVMYFDGSVKGLSVGSPVVFRGVKIGSVIDIGMLFNTKDITVLIPVYVQLGEADVEIIDDATIRIKPGERKKIVYEYTDALIKRGIRAQLETQSFVTGQLQIALDFYPNKPARFVGATTKYPEIPTIPTQLQELTKRLEQIPIEDIVTKLRSTLEGIDKMANSPELTRMMTSFGQTSDETKNLVREINLHVKPLAASIRGTSDEAGVTLKKLQSVADNIEYTTGENSILAYKLDKTLGEMERAARAIRLLAESIDEQPESLIFGKKTREGTR